MYWKEFPMNSIKSKQKVSKHNDLGKEGEELAEAFLLEKGYLIRSRNYRYLKAEVDIIAIKGDILAIVEVKFRTTAFIENIADTITRRKISLLVMAADHYVTQRNLDVEVRFDIITILLTQKSTTIEHLENAFYHF
jgi:putative endonuclease